MADFQAPAPYPPDEPDEVEVPDDEQPQESEQEQPDTNYTWPQNSTAATNAVNLSFTA